MAARENQGLQIALIVCAMLIVALAVTSFVFYNSSKDETLRADNAQQNAKKSDETLRKAVDDMSQLKQLIGFPVGEEVAAVVTGYKKDVETYAATMRESEQNYRNIVSQLATALQKQTELLGDSEALNRKMKEDFDAQKKADLAAIEEYKAGLNKAADDLKQEKAKFFADRERSKKEDAELLHKFEGTKKELDDKIAKSSKDLDETEKLLRKALETNDSLISRGNEQELSTEMADGKVTWVNQNGRLVWMNLGSDDGLRRQISFTVIGSNELNPIKAEKKGTVEVVRVLDGHLAEARIMDDKPTDPIMPGDQLFSAAWRPNHPEHFALVGLMDLDKDGLSDLARVREMITVNGGIIDAELQDDGKVVGQMNVDTQYLVMGKIPDEKQSNEYRNGYSEMIKESKALPIKTISLPDLVRYLGYKDYERTIPLGKDSKPSDFVPDPKDKVFRRSGNDSFRKRLKPPTRGKIDSIY